MKKLIFLLLITAFSYVLVAEPLVLFYTNDTHGAYQPRAIKTAAGTDSVGGYVSLFQMKSYIGADTPHLWLDAGDQQTGSVFSAFDYKGAIGGAVVESFNRMGLDAATLGNHEFDQSLSNTSKLIKLARYPFLSANVVWKKNGKPITGKPYAIFKRGKLRIGVIGLTLTELQEKVKAENVKDLKVLPYKQAIDKYIDKLDKKTDLIILLTHNGLEADSLLATRLDKRVDIIVGGHTHNALTEPMLVNGIIIVQSGAYLNNLGYLVLDVQNDKVEKIVNPASTLIQLSHKNIADAQENIVSSFASSLGSLEILKNNKSKAARAKVKEINRRGFAFARIAEDLNAFTEFIQGISAQISQDMDKVIGTIPVNWTPSKYEETDVSRWQAQALLAEYKDQYKADMAMINCGGIRKAIPAGEVTLRDMTEMLPFNNYIVVFSCKGSDLLKFWDINEQHKLDKPYDIVQSTLPGWVYGIKSSANPTQKPWFEIENGIRLEPEKVYRVVTHDYLSGQWDKYLGFKPFDVVETGDLIYDVMVKQVELQYGAKKALTK